MNILYISYDGATDPLGQSQITPYLKFLSGEEFKFTLLTFDKKNFLGNNSLVSKIEKSLEASNINWNVLTYHKSPALSATLYDIVIGLLAGLRLVKKNNISVVHARSYVASLIAVLLKITTGCKYIFDMRGFWPEEKIEGGAWKRRGILFSFFKFLEKIFISQADSIVVLSWKAKAILEKYHKGDVQNITVIPTCTDLTLFKFKNFEPNPKTDIIKQGKFILMYLGSIGTWYCLDEMMNFFKIAKQQFDNAYFIFLISQKWGEVEQLMLSKGFHREDFMIKNVYYDEVPEWLCIAEASVFFIKPVFSKLASCPTKLGESLACGIPVIINSGIGDTENIVKRDNVGVVIDSFSDISYRGKLEEFKELLYNKNELAQRCRLTAEKYFSLQSGAEQYARIYRSMKK